MRRARQAALTGVLALGLLTATQAPATASQLGPIGRQAEAAQGGALPETPPSRANLPPTRQRARTLQAGPVAWQLAASARGWTPAANPPSAPPKGPPFATPAPTPTASPALPMGATPTPPKQPTPRKAPRGVVYLTFDDGPWEDSTASILATLRRYDVRATFFVIGRNAMAHPDLLAQIRAGGHAVANHTWGHPDLTRLTAAQIGRQLRATAKVIGSSRCMRAPYGSTNPRVERAIKAAGYVDYLWDLDVADWTRPPVRTMVSGVLGGVRAGSIVLLHDGGGDRSRTAAAVARIVPALLKAGYDIRPLPGC